jgi:hypothetical protein
VQSHAQGVNPAFLQEIKDSHPNLWESVAQLGAFAKIRLSGGKVPCRDLVHWLNELRDQLALQFTLEEGYGYVPGKRQPFIEDRIEVALEQHRRLFLDLVDLCEIAEDLQYRGVISGRGTPIVQQIEWFLGNLRNHEALEREIIGLASQD